MRKKLHLVNGEYHLGFSRLGVRVKLLDAEGAVASARRHLVPYAGVNGKY